MIKHRSLVESCEHAASAKGDTLCYSYIGISLASDGHSALGASAAQTQQRAGHQLPWCTSALLTVSPLIALNEPFVEVVLPPLRPSLERAVERRHQTKVVGLCKDVHIASSAHTSPH